MKRDCPNCRVLGARVTKYGHFVRGSDKRRLRRHKCHFCLKTFSDASFQQCYRQNKRHLNQTIKRLLASCVSQRRIAKIVKVHRTTVARRLLHLGQNCRAKNELFRKRFQPAVKIQFDDLETFEHTKCKPLSVIMAVEEGSRRILGFRVSVMPSKGPLAKLSRKKYGPRKDQRKLGRESLFKEIQPHVTAQSKITSDESPHYPASVRKWFPQAEHVVTKGKRGCVTGQGELKKVGFDPLFSLNHTFAMLRANINRLVRKTWCTTKNIDCLRDHIEIYVHYHNTELTKQV